jgi:protein-tyrosine phosphatase
MKAFVKREGLADKIYCDSAGIIGNHEGNSADSRMQVHALKRGFNLTSISRPVDKHTDFDTFDMIIGMDDQNIQDLNSLARDENDRSKIYRMTDFAEEFDYNVVPDPYYGGEVGFELVLDLLEDACTGLIKHIGE